MTPQEFKAWFDGFTDAMDEPPTPKQWKRIKSRVAEIDNTPITERVFVERYWPAYYGPWYGPYYAPYFGRVTAGGAGGATSLELNGTYPGAPTGAAFQNHVDDGHKVWSANAAMLCLGQSDYHASLER